MKEKEPRTETEIFADLLQLCKEPGFAHSIAFFCFRGNWLSFKDDITGKILAERKTPDSLIRTEIATLIGGLVTGDLNLEHPGAKGIADHLLRAEALLEEIHQRMIFDAFSSIKEGESPLSTGEGIREAAFYAAESALPFQYKDFSEVRYAGDIDWLDRTRGFNLGHGKLVLDALVDIQSKIATEHMKTLRTSDPTGWSVLPAFYFDAGDVVEATGLPESNVRAFLEAFSEESNSNKAFDAIGAFNTTNVRPIIKVGDGFILFQYASLAEAVYESPFFWMLQDKAYKDTATQNRGQFTEDFTYDCMVRVFGETNVSRNIDLFAGKSKVGEIDVLVSFGEYAIVCQCKSKKLTLDARRGSLPVIKGDFKTAVQSAYDQCFLCSEVLQSGKFEARDSMGQVIEITPPLKVFPVTILSDHYPALSLQVQQFLSRKSSVTIFEPFCVDLFTLDVLTELVPSPVRVISYLERRSKYYDRVMTTNELAILGYFLRSNLWLEGEFDFIYADDSLSSDIDAAMFVRREGLPGAETPEGLLTRFHGTFIHDVIEQIERDPNALCVELGLTLLEFSEDAINNISRLVRRMCKKGDGDITLPVENRSSGLTLHCNNLPEPFASEMLRGHMLSRKYSQRASQWLGLVLEPSTCRVRFGEYVRQPHVFNYELEASMASAPSMQKTIDLIKRRPRR